MQEKWFELQNMSSEAQHVFDEVSQKRWTIEANTILPFPERIARLFLDSRARYVRPYSPPTIPDVPGEPKIWMANVTGNPFLPDMVPNKDGVMVPNPNRKPITLTRYMHVSQETRKRSDGFEEVYNWPPVRVELAPYKRIAVPISIGGWLEQRDSQQNREHIGKLMKCRAPTAWEPNETWTLDEIRTYAALVDDKFIDIIKEFPPEFCFTDDEKKEQTKLRLLQVLFFRVIDEKFNLPTEAFFKEKFALIKRQEERSKEAILQKKAELTLVEGSPVVQEIKKTRFRRTKAELALARKAEAEARKTELEKRGLPTPETPAP